MEINIQIIDIHRAVNWRATTYPPPSDPLKLWLPSGRQFQTFLYIINCVYKGPSIAKFSKILFTSFAYPSLPFHKSK